MNPNPFEEHDTYSAELRALRSDIKEWALGIRCLFMVLSLLPLYYCSRMLLAAPRFERIFEEMLGSKSQLPVLTRLVFEWWLPLLGCVWLFTAVMIALIFIVKQVRYVWITAATSAFVLIFTGHLVATVLFDPLVAVIQNLSGGGILP